MLLVTKSFATLDKFCNDKLSEPAEGQKFKPGSPNLQEKDVTCSLPCKARKLLKKFDL